MYIQKGGVGINKHDLKIWYIKYKHIIAWVIAACVVIVFYHTIANFGQVKSFFLKVIDVVMPFIFGAILAYILKPICNIIAKVLNKISFMQKVPKVVNVVSVICTYVFASGIVTLFVIAVIPPLIDSAVNITQNLPATGQNIVNTIKELASENQTVQNLASELYQRINTTLKTEFIPSISDIVDLITKGTLGAFDLIKNIFIGIIASVYLLLDRERLSKIACRGLDICFKPPTSKSIKEECGFIDKVFTRYLTGTLLDALLVGLVTYIFALIVGLPSPILLAVIIACTNVIPIVGPFIGAIPTAIIVLAYTPDKFLMYCIYLLVLQQIDGHIFVPKVLGSVVGISGLTALFAIIVGGGLFGIPGMILGVPVITVIIDLTKKGIIHYKSIRKPKKTQENL